jgi:hypothetical protein
MHFSAGTGGQEWELGLMGWQASINVGWRELDEVAEALEDHHDGTGRRDDLFAVLAAHGVPLRDEEFALARVGAQDALHARLWDELGRASGRHYLADMRDVYRSADELSQEAARLVGALLRWDGPNEAADDLAFDDVGLSDEVRDLTDLMTQEVLLLNSVHITPVLRGHLLGAWGAAQTIASLTGINCLIATEAAPLDKRDAAPDFDDSQTELSETQQRQWHAEQERLAGHWAVHLGLSPLPSQTHVLVGHKGMVNAALEETLALWSEGPSH